MKLRSRLCNAGRSSGKPASFTVSFMSPFKYSTGFNSGEYAGSAADRSVATGDEDAPCSGRDGVAHALVERVRRFGADVEAADGAQRFRGGRAVAGARVDECRNHSGLYYTRCWPARQMPERRRPEQVAPAFVATQFR